MPRATPEQIRDVLKQNPNLTTAEDVQDKCSADGLTVGLWAVYFVARDMGRQLGRRPAHPSDDDLREVALIFYGLHKGMKQAMDTLDKLESLNTAGTRIEWENESTSTAYGWEMSVAQEFADRAGGILKAKETLLTL